MAEVGRMRAPSTACVARWSLPIWSVLALACQKPAPSPLPAPAFAPAPTAATTTAPSTSPDSIATSGGAPGTKPATVDAGPDAVAGIEPGAPPPLLDDTGALLAQTDERPTAESAFFQRLGPALWQAILEDDAKLALPWFFPVEAYRAVKAIAEPDRDWETRLVRHFERDIHDYRMQLGKFRDEMQYVRIEVPSDGAKWMKPHSECNKLGYWRVLRAQLVYLDREQRERRMEITSMISWRGEWYVVHLHGFE
jgi:hypothetical protein